MYVHTKTSLEFNNKLMHVDIYNSTNTAMYHKTLVVANFWQIWWFMTNLLNFYMLTIFTWLICCCYGHATMSRDKLYTIV